MNNSVDQGKTEPNFITIFNRCHSIYTKIREFNAVLDKFEGVENEPKTNPEETRKEKEFIPTFGAIYRNLPKNLEFIEDCLETLIQRVQNLIN